MSQFFAHVWNRLPSELQDRLRAQPDATLTGVDLDSLQRAGIPTVHMEGMEVESDLAEPTLSPAFQSWIRSHD